MPFHNDTKKTKGKKVKGRKVKGKKVKGRFVTIRSNKNSTYLYRQLHTLLLYLAAIDGCVANGISVSVGHTTAELAQVYQIQYPYI